VVSFLKVQNLRLKQRVTAIVRCKVSTWIVDVTDSDVRITHFKVYVPRVTCLGEAMRRSWARRRLEEMFPACDVTVGGEV